MVNLSLCITGQCNLQCKYCFSDKKKGLSDIDLIKLNEFLYYLSKREEINNVFITGGEPLLYYNFYELIESISKLSSNIYLLTNGVLLSEYVMNLLDHYKVKVHISLDSCNSNYHEFVRGNQKETIENIKKIQVYENIETTICVTLSYLNVNEIRYIEQFAKKYGCKTDYNLLCLDNDYDLSWDNSDPIHKAQLIENLTDWAENNKKQTKLLLMNYILNNSKYSIKRCLYSRNNIVLFSNGDSYPCFVNRADYFGNIYYNPFESIMQLYNIYNNKTLE